ncbi:MAG: ABC transporter ATP-binding protein, partial [Erythrobacter sp.]|nr:ABC transporter ATP-binding protein [Erythrobacter sp.]
ALSLAIEFDCYLIDEVIMVGDQRFHAKCAEELFEKRASRAMIIASHDMTAIRSYCSKAVVLEAGKITPFADVEEAVEIYNAL